MPTAQPASRPRDEDVGHVGKEPTDINIPGCFLPGTVAAYTSYV
jgi:hypothetical protein